MKNFYIVLIYLSALQLNAQTNNFPLYSSGNYTGGSGDYTNIGSPHLKLHSPSSYPRVVHLSSTGGVSTVYNYETGKNAYWGEPADVGQYIFRGRDMLVSEGKLGIGINTSNPLNGLHVFKSGDFAGGSIRFGFSSSFDGMMSMGWNPGTSGDAIKFSYFAHNATSAQTDLMTLSINGNVGIGTTSPNQKLTVNGTIYGKEVKVDLSVPGPDYVFDEDYKLASLDSIQSYIHKNKHLPEVPSAREMEEKGINVSEMNMLLLKKVEELTLYVIELKSKQEVSDRKIEELLYVINKK